MLRRSDIIATLGCVALLFVSGAAGCGADRGPPGPIRFRAMAAGVAFESPFPARLDVALGSMVSAFELTASAGSDRGVWNARATFTREQTLAGSAALTVGTSALVPASVQIDGSRALRADTGTLDVSFGQGAISGTVTGASPELLDGSFSGEVEISCWVPPAALPGSNPSIDGGPTAPDGVETLVPDEKFESTPCLPFDSLRLHGG